MADSFDVVILGGGPGGYVAALRAAQLGAKTAIVEKDRLGGTCLVRGCIPTKALLQSSELYSQAKAGAAFGLVADSVGFDWAIAQKRKTAVVDQLVKGVEGLLKAGGVTVYRGSARLTGKGGVSVGDDKITAKDIVIATGSAVSRIPLKGAEHTIDSDQILELKEIPARLAVIGGGVVGMEFAAMFSALGSKVTVLEMLPQVLPMVDADLVNVYAKHLAGLGGVIHTNSKVAEVAKVEGRPAGAVLRGRRGRIGRRGPGAARRRPLSLHGRTRRRGGRREARARARRRRRASAHDRVRASGRSAT